LPVPTGGQCAAVNLSWKAEGACRWVEPDLFYPVSDSDAGPAKEVCAGCGVRERCLDYALTCREFDGVWGGLTGTERRALYRRRKLVTA
jgi:WhiB family transcriptional regulator, redox-sensing transcriptional regulator